MNKSILISSLCMFGAALGLATVTGDASAYTRSVCAIAGTTDHDANWAKGNCAMHNVSSGKAILKFSIPTDSSYDIEGRVSMRGDNYSKQGSAQLITFNDNLYYWTDNPKETIGASPFVQTIYTNEINMHSSEGTATLIVEAAPDMWVYSAQIAQ